MPKVVRRIIVNRPVHEVISELKKEGWRLVVCGNGRALFYRDRSTRAKIAHSKNN